eukprot:10497618-Heterocapsa_arctica.AAC.1
MVTIDGGSFCHSLQEGILHVTDVMIGDKLIDSLDHVWVQGGCTHDKAMFQGRFAPRPGDGLTKDKLFNNENGKLLRRELVKKLEIEKRA